MSAPSTGRTITSLPKTDNGARAAFYTAFDYKYIFIVSVSLFEIGSIICGTAPTMDALVVGRVVAGIGGSGIYIG